MNKGVHLLLDAIRGLDARAVIVGFGDHRRALEQQARTLPDGQTLFTGPLEHRHLVHLLPLADVAVVPSIFPEAFGMVAAEAAATGCPPLVARHSGLAEVAAGLEAEYPERLRHLAAFESGDVADLARSSGAARAPPPTARRCASRARPAAVVDVGRWRASRQALRAGRPARGGNLRPAWARNRSSLPTSSSRSHGAFENGTDFTLAVEEEFAILDPGRSSSSTASRISRPRHSARTSSRTSSGS